MYKVECRLIVYSPVHVGNGNELTPVDYVAKNNEIRVIDLSRYLAEKVALTNWRNVNVEEKVREAGENKDYILYTTGLRRGEPQRTIFELLKEICGDSICVSIPGSTIKGAIRTAIAYWLLTNGAVDIIRKVISTGDGEKLESLLFQAGTGDAKKDALRALSISDTSSLVVKPETVEVVMVKTLSGRDFEGFSTYYETIKPGCEFKFELGIDTRLTESKFFMQLLGWKSNGVSPVEMSIDEIRQAINSFSLKIIEYELRFFKSCGVKELEGFYVKFKEKMENSPSNTCYIALARGAGWLKSTVNMALQNKERLEYIQKKKLNSPGKGLKRVTIGGEEFSPKSRMLVMENDNEPVGPMAWVKIEFGHSQEEFEKIKNAIKLRIPVKIPERTTGQVKWFNEKKGYGFIEREDGEGEIFVHKTEMKEKIEEGDRVAFWIVSTKEGRFQAVDVVKL